MNTDVLPPKPAPAPELKEPPAEQAQTPLAPESSKDQKKQPAPKPPTQKNGVGAAIAATVVIVLGLAALATYAYLQTR